MDDNRGSSSSSHNSIGDQDQVMRTKAQSLLASGYVKSFKRPFKDSLLGSTDESKKKAKSSSEKKPKVSVVPPARTTVKQEILEKFSKSKNAKPKKQDLVPKRVIMKNAIPTSTITSFENQNDSFLMNGSQNMTEDEFMDHIKKGIASGKIRLSENSSQVANKSSPGTTAIIEKSDENNDYFSDNSSQDLPNTNPASPTLSDTSEQTFSFLHTQDTDLLSGTDDGNSNGIRDEEQENSYDESQSQDSELIQKTALPREVPPKIVSSQQNSPLDGTKVAEKETVVASNQLPCDGDNVKVVGIETHMHGDNCCYVCVGVMNEILRNQVEIKEWMKSRDRAVIPSVLRPISEEEFKNLPHFQLEEQDDLVLFESTLQSKPDAVNEYMIWMGKVGGSDPKTAMTNVLKYTMTDELADTCTWILQKDSKIVVGGYYLFKVISAFIAAKFDGARDKKGQLLDVSMDSNLKIMKDWISRSSDRLRLARLAAEKAAQLKQMKAKQSQ